MPVLFLADFIGIWPPDPPPTPPAWIVTACLLVPILLHMLLLIVSRPFRRRRSPRHDIMIRRCLVTLTVISASILLIGWPWTPWQQLNWVKVPFGTSTIPNGQQFLGLHAWLELTRWGPASSAYVLSASPRGDLSFQIWPKELTITLIELLFMLLATLTISRWLAVPPTSGRCRNCGYRLQGLTSTHCPECGDGIPS